MKRDKLESLFRKKLENFEQEVSEDASGAVLSLIKQKRRKRIIARISVAASVILLIGLGSLFLLTEDTAYEAGMNNEISSAKEGLMNNETESSVEDKEVEQINDVAEIAAQEEIYELNNQALEENEVKSMKKSIPVQKEIIDVPVLKPVIAAESSPSIPEVDTLTLRPQVLIAAQAEMPSSDLKESVEAPVKERKKVTIEYIASGSSKQEKGVKKIYKKIENMKTADEMLADVRNFKDQLFALDFIKKENKEKKDKTTKE